MDKPKTTTRMTHKPVGATLYFEDNTLVLKLTKRVPGPKYKRAQDIIESTLLRVFGSGCFQHKRGSTTSSIVGATAAQADLVAAGISLHEDTISLVYKRPEEVDVPTPKKVSGHKSAIETLKSEIESLDRQIKCNQDDVERFQAMVDKTQGFLRENIQKRSELVATIRALKA